MPLLLQNSRSFRLSSSKAKLAQAERQEKPPVPLCSHTDLPFLRLSIAPLWPGPGFAKGGSKAPLAGRATMPKGGFRVAYMLIGIASKLGSRVRRPGHLVSYKCFP